MGLDRLKAIRDQRAQQAGTQDVYGSAPSQASSDRRQNPFDQRDESPANQYGGGGYGGGGAGAGGYGQSTYNQPSQAPYDPPNQYQQQSGYGGGSNDTYQASSYPPTNTYNNYDGSQAEKGLAPAGDDMNAFYTEIDEIKREIADFSGNVDQISRIHQTLLNNVQSGNSPQKQQLTRLMEQTRQQSVALKERIKTVKRQPVTERAHAQRKQQLEYVSKRFMDAIEKYQNEEKEYRDKYKDRMARQLRIAQPNATDDEVAAVVNGDRDVQIFAQNAMGNRYANAQGVYREVQERNEGVKQIERTLMELSDLFTDMSILVDQQDDHINIIHENTVNTNKYVTEGREQLDKAKVSARGYRKKRWICFFITLIILAIIGIIVGIEVAKNVNNNKDNNNSGTTSSSSSTSTAS